MFLTHLSYREVRLLPKQASKYRWPICVAKHDSNTIKFADDTTVVGLITDNDEAGYREVRDLAVWCQDPNHST
jgi:hypothetical protein